MSLAGLLALTFAGLPGSLPHPDGSASAETLRPAAAEPFAPIGPPDALLPTGLRAKPANAEITAANRPPARTDLALLVGETGRGPQFELGALGGGRRDAPGLVHVGVRFGF